MVMLAPYAGYLNADSYHGYFNIVSPPHRMGVIQWGFMPSRPNLYVRKYGREPEQISCLHCIDILFLPYTEHATIY